MTAAPQMPATLLALLQQRAERAPDGEATRHLRSDALVSTTWSAWWRRSRVLAAGLVGLDVQPGERVAILCSTRVEWAWLDVVCMMAGAVSVPIFPTEAPRGVAAVLADSGARLCFVEDPVQAAKVVEVREGLPGLREIIWIDREASPSPRVSEGQVVGWAEAGIDPAAEGLSSLDAFRAQSELDVERYGEEVDRRIRDVASGDVATLTYTPGTEGRPKGVMLSHRNFVSTCTALTVALRLGEEDVQLLYLSLAQAFARTSLYTAVAAGAVTCFGRSYRTVLEDCQTYAPTFVCAVPSLFERIRAGRLHEREDMPGLQRFALDQALGAAARVAEPGLSDTGLLAPVREEVAERFVFGPMRRLFGGRLRFAISGGAPLSPDVGRYFREHGLEVIEGYGMTETCACSAINRPDDNVHGTVGRPIASVEVRVTEDEELCVRGPGVTAGIWNDPVATREGIDGEGWLHTGDLVELDEEGRIRINDRKRDVIITAHGKAIAPGPIAEALRTGPLVARAVIHGEGRSFLSALITLDAEGLDRFAARHGLEGDYATLTRSPVVYTAIEEHVRAVSATRAGHEAIRKFAILSGPLSEHEGEVTPTRRVRRRVTTERHRALLDSFYSEQY